MSSEAGRDRASPYSLDTPALKYRLTSAVFPRYNVPGQLNSLIKSGGGNGPVKPGNLRVYARC